MASGLSVYRQCLRSVQQSKRTTQYTSNADRRLVLSALHAGFRGDQYMLHNSRKELRSKFEVQQA